MNRHLTTSFVVLFWVVSLSNSRIGYTQEPPPIVTYEFDKTTLAENGWGEVPGGFLGNPAGTISLVNFSGNQFSSSQDQKGLALTVNPKQVVFIYAVKPINTGGNPVLLRMTVRANASKAAVALVALRGNLSTYSGVDGSIATHIPASAESFVQNEKRLVLVYQPDMGNEITPAIQVAATGNQETVTVWVDKLEVLPSDPLGYGNTNIVFGPDSAKITYPYLHLAVGNEWHFEGYGEYNKGYIRNEVCIGNDQVKGISCIVIQKNHTRPDAWNEKLYLAQDNYGNVRLLRVENIIGDPKNIWELETPKDAVMFAPAPGKVGQVWSFGVMDGEVPSFRCIVSAKGYVEKLPSGLGPFNNCIVVTDTQDLIDADSTFYDYQLGPVKLVWNDNEGWNLQWAKVDGVTYPSTVPTATLTPMPVIPTPSPTSSTTLTPTVIPPVTPTFTPNPTLMPTPTIQKGNILEMMQGDFWSLRIELNTLSAKPFASWGSATIRENLFTEIRNTSDGRAGYVEQYLTISEEGLTTEAINRDFMVAVDKQIDEHRNLGTFFLLRKESNPLSIKIPTGETWEYWFFGHYIGVNSSSSSGNWGTVKVKWDGTGTTSYTSTSGKITAGTFTWKILANGMMQATVLETGKTTTWGIGPKANVMMRADIDPIDNDDLGYQFLIRKGFKPTRENMAGECRVSEFATSLEIKIPHTMWGNGTVNPDQALSYTGVSYFNDDSPELVSGTMSFNEDGSVIMHRSNDNPISIAYDPTGQLGIAFNVPTLDAPKEDQWVGLVFLVKSPVVAAPQPTATLTPVFTPTATPTPKPIPTSTPAITFSLKDLQGISVYHGIVTGDASANQLPGWYYGSTTTDEKGHVAYGPQTDSLKTNYIPKAQEIAITPEGQVIFPVSPSHFHGVMNLGKDMMVSVATMAPGPDYGIRGFNLLVGIKQEGTFTPNDLQGTWNFHLLESGDAPQWNGWVYGTIQIDSNGRAVFLNNLTSDGLTTLKTPFTLGMDKSGIITPPGNSSFHGIMSRDKSMIVSTLNGSRGGYALWILQRTGDVYSPTDMQGLWNIHAVISGDKPQYLGWYYGQAVIDPSGFYESKSMNRSDEDSHLGSSVQISITSDGTVTTKQLPTFHGFLNSRKDTMVMTMTDGGGGFTLGIMMKAP